MLTKPRDPAKVLTQSTHKKRRSPLMLIGVTVTVLVALIGVGVFVVLPQLTNSHAAAALNTACTLVVPPNPLSAQGLATPYQLVATNAGNGPCNEANAGQSAFVQADIIDPATGQITSYAPLVIDQGTQPAVVPTAPTLPANAVVAIWFGFNATTLTLQNNAQTKGHGHHIAVNMTMRGGTNGNCVNGTAGSPFGQFAYCNAPNFFRAANAAIQAGTLKIPALGTASDGKPCMTVRDFGMVDMDQSDNVQTKYLANGNGQTAQFTAANQAALANATTIANPSDNALLTAFLDPALGCTPFTVPDLTDNNNPVSTYGTDELMAAADQQAPIALVPGGDEMTLVNGNQNLGKVNLYRAGANQTPAASLTGTAATDANTTTYCTNIVNVGLPRLQLDMNTFLQKASPDGGATANSLFTFLANRMNATLGAGGLNCVGLLNIQNPIALTTDGNGVVTAATLTIPPVAAGGTTTTTPTATTTTTTNTATGTVSATLDTNAGNAQVANNINIANFANQQFFVNITDSATGKQVLHQSENTDGNGANATAAVINGLQGLTAIPATWNVSITDANGNVLGSAPMVSNGVTGTATLTATSTTSTGTTPTAGATPTTTGGGKHHHHG
jgi:hypothetical protein